MSTCANLLTSATGPYGNGTLTYDPVMRLFDSGTGGRTRVLHDGEQRIAEYSQAGGQRNRVVFGPGMDEPLIEYSGSGLATVRYLYADERGSIAGGADAAGNSVGVGTYDDYGQSMSFASGRFGYAGQPYETVSDLQYSRARFYNPRRGRFMQPDPIGYEDGMNPYAYVGGDPINFTDPLGLRREEQSEEIEILVTGQRLRPLRAAARGGGGGGMFVPAPTVRESVEPVIVVTAELEKKPRGRGRGTRPRRSGGKEHTRNARPSTQEQHERGQSRQTRDQGGERADERRRPQRRRPQGHRGPWPPKLFPPTFPFLPWMYDICYGPLGVLLPEGGEPIA